MNRRAGKIVIASPVGAKQSQNIDCFARVFLHSQDVSLAMTRAYRVLLGASGLFFFFFFFLFLPIALAQSVAGQKPGAKENLNEAVGKAFGHFITIQTGTLQDGEQIPLPHYQDGKEAKRKDCHYIVSPREISTAFNNLVGSGAYYIKNFADSDGVVHISLWQRGADGSDFNVVEDKAYEDLKQYYQSIGTQYEGSDTFRNNLIGELKKRMTANYMVIALRSQSSH